jgi:dCMP deaminase
VLFRSHCIDTPCPGAHLKSGEGLDICKAIHAEQNALLQCRNVYEIKYVYTTLSPCIHCVKLLLNTSAEGIITFEKYVDFDTVGKFWMDNGGQSWAYINKEIILGKCSSSLN